MGFFPQFLHHNVACNLLARSAQDCCAQRIGILSNSKLEGEELSLVAMPRVDALFTLLRIITVCLHTVKLHVCMLWLTMILQRPAAARRTIAIELLRRFDQLEGEGRRSHSTASSHRRSADAIYGDKQLRPIRPDSRGRCPSSLATHARFEFHKQDTCIEATIGRKASPTSSDSSIGTDPNKLATHDVSALRTELDLTSTGSAQLHSARAWTKTWPRDSRNIDSLRLQAQQDTLAKPTPPASLSGGARSSSMHDDILVATSQPGGSQLLVVTSLTDRSTETDCAPLLADPDTSGSDATSPEGYRSSFPLSGKAASSVDEDTVDEDTVDGARESESEGSEWTLTSTTGELSSTVDESRGLRHRRLPSLGSNGSITKTAATLRTRSKPNGGLLEFRANSAKPRDFKSARIHRRNVSLYLPVRPVASQPGSIQTTKSSPAAATALVPTPSCDDVNTATQTERVLQYKYRHIFVGTASLYSFLEALETSSVGTTSKLAVMKAFTVLASNEQITFRQASPSTEDWHLVTRITSNISTFDCITLARVQLGSVSLQQFVNLIPFDSTSEAPTAVVVEAFKNASHIDAEAGLNTRSKARAFRMLSLGHTDALE